MKKIVPSILSADFSRIGSQIKELEQAGVDRIHMDVMDGHFVPNISFGFPVIQSLRACTEMLFDVHLMVQEPENCIRMAAEAGADIITVHVEACTHLHRTIQQMRQYGCKAGVALNPATPLQSLEYVVRELDVVLLMTVNPGFGGQTFIVEMLDKIARCRELLSSKQCSPSIELDGGITQNNAWECMNAGADILVSGSSIFHGDIRKNVESLTQAI